jgi:hypothetical protein
VIEKLAFDKEAAQICASERVTIMRAQAPRSEAQIELRSRRRQKPNFQLRSV